jgi:hypothetical protein
MPKLIILIWMAVMVLIFSACGVKGGGHSPLLFKRITPAMETEMEKLIEKGCDKEYQFFDRDIAMLYSVIPGGGQWYTGETHKAWIYLVSFPLIVPYIVSFQDAQNSVDYYNFRYTAHFCKAKLKTDKELLNEHYLSKSPRKRENKLALQDSGESQF